MESLLRHHIDSTEKRFDKVDEKLSEINEKLLELHDFKTETKATAKHVSLIVSGITGLIMLLVSAVINSIINKH